jgi:hypothetical protein
MMAVFDGIVSLYLSILRRLLERRPDLSDSSVCLLNRRIVTSEFNRDELVLFDTGNRSVYLLNHTAAAVIRLTDGTRDLGEVARWIAREFGEKEKTVTRDAKRICRELIIEGVFTMAHDRSFKPIIKRETVIREEDDGAFIFDPITDELFAINETGLLVVKQINGKKSLAEIIDTVATHFSDVDAHEVGRDVEAFVEGLVSRGLIVG